MASPLLSFYLVNNIQRCSRSLILVDGLSRQNTRPVLFNIASMLYFGQDSKVVEYPAYWTDRVPILRVLCDGNSPLPRNAICLLNKNLGLTRKVMSSWPHERVPSTTPTYTRSRPRNIPEERMNDS